MSFRTARMFRGGGVRASVAALAVLTCPGVAAAVTADLTDNANNPDVVYVTARREVERAQDVPISLTAVSGYRLEANGVTNLAKLTQLVPSLEILAFNPRNTSITVRGLGANIGITNDGVEAGVGVYVDGVLHARPATATFELPDIASIEVLRGPQGTLYGKNSVAGTINANSAMPTSYFEAYGRIALGDYGYRNVFGTVSGPLDASGRWSGRLTALYVGGDGTYTNAFDGKTIGEEDDFGLRGQLLYREGDAFSLRFIADYSFYNAQEPVRVISGVVTTLANGQTLPRNFYDRAAAAGYTPLPIDPYARITDANSPIRSKTWEGGVSAQADWKLGSLTFTSISAFRFWGWRPKNDDDLTSLSILTDTHQNDDERQVTQEFRVTSAKGGPIDYSAGLFYFWEQTDGDGRIAYGPDASLWVFNRGGAPEVAGINGFETTADSVPRTNSYAAYGQATWHALPDFDVTAGLRYTYEYKTGGYDQRVAGSDISSYAPAQQALIQVMRDMLATRNVYSLRTSDNLLGGLVTFSYHVNDDVMTYATYSHGEKSAGLNLANLAAGVPKVLKPELVDNYEVGIKSFFPAARMTLNADLFWTEDTNYQTTLLDMTRFVIYLANIPEVRSRGFEIDLNANPVEGLVTYASVAYTDAIYVSYPNAPAPFEAYTVAGGRLMTGVTVDLSNRQLPAASRWALSAGAEYSGSLARFGLGGFTGYFGMDESYRSAYFSNSSLSVYARVPGYALTNLRAGIRTDDGRWDLQFWSRNLFDQDYIIARVPTLFNTGALSTLIGDPRTVGATLAMRM